MVLSHREAPSKLCLKVRPRHPHPRTSWLYLLPGNLHSQTFNLIFFSETFLCSHLCGDGANSRAQRAWGPVHTPQWCIRMASPVSQAPSTAHHCTHSRGTHPSLKPQSLLLAHSLSVWLPQEEVPMTRCPIQAPDLFAFRAQANSENSVVGRQRTC